jgi:uncharacterized membrane protein
MTQAITTRASRHFRQRGMDSQHPEAKISRRRRWIIGLSLLGIAAMSPVVLLQLHVVHHLPDPPWPRFNSDKANLSPYAYRFVIPDGVLVMGSMVGSVVLSLLGGRNRTRQHPWIPVTLAAKLGVDVFGAGSYFYLMASGQAPWCIYCITGAATLFASLPLALPEAWQARKYLFE